MNDRYLFKAKDKFDKHKWVYGGIVYEANGCDEGDDYYAIATRNDDEYHVDETPIIPETICQCTGLKDRNGKLIYENDILLHEPTNREMKVVYKGGCFWGISRQGEYLLGRISELGYLTVLRNKFDNTDSTVPKDVDIEKVNKIIAESTARYPFHICHKGHLNENEIELLKRYCDVEDKGSYNNNTYYKIRRNKSK